jgi:hypothetical protein
MSQTFTDEDLLTWEVFPTAGQYGLATRPKVVFHCVSDRARRPRYVMLDGDEASAEEVVYGSGVQRLRAMLRGSRELD